MKILLVKRLESSFHAFRLTVARFIRSYERVITEFQKGHVYISKKHINKLFDLLETDNEEGLDRLLEAEKAERLDAADFNADFIKLLRSDLKTLRQIEEMWERVRRDPKWISFRDLLKTSKLRSSKLIIFTESKATAEYLGQRIAKEVEKDVLVFNGSSEQAVRKQVLSNFDARAFRPSNEFRILVATEVLSEGVNLHRSNVVLTTTFPGTLPG
jgi:superfamily II DNA or RNA helicase